MFVLRFFASLVLPQSFDIQLNHNEFFVHTNVCAIVTFLSLPSINRTIVQRTMTHEPTWKKTAHRVSMTFRCTFLIDCVLGFFFFKLILWWSFSFLKMRYDEIHAKGSWTMCKSSSGIWWFQMYDSLFFFFIGLLSVYFRFIFDCMPIVQPVVVFFATSIDKC